MLAGGNYIHSCNRYGLRIENYAPRKNPCQEISTTNPAVEAVFQNYIISSTPVGIYAQNIGEVNFASLTVGDTKRAGMWLDRVSRRTSAVVITSSSFVNTNVANDPQVTHQIVVPPNNGALKFVSCKYGSSMAQTVVFDYTNKQMTTIFDTAFSLEGSVPTGQVYTLKWDQNKTNIIYDTTGSLTFLADAASRTNGGIVVPSHPHLLASTVCPAYTASSTWDPTLICNDGVSGRTVTFSKAAGSLSQDTSGADLRIWQLATATSSLSTVTTSTTGLTTISDQGGYWKVPMLNGKIYAVWWSNGADLRNLSISLPSYYTNDAHNAIILRFNYTETKEILEVAKVLNDVIQTPLVAASTAALDAATCNFGDYYHDATAKHIFVCVSDKLRTVNEFKIGALNCLHFCDTANLDREDFVRNWSNTTNWQGGVVPASGADVVIPATWTVKLDIDPPALNSLIIRGNLFVEGRDATLQTGFMWV